MNPLLYTIGHSNHEMATFLQLLHLHGITAVHDVRSHPYSRYVPQYSRDALEVALHHADISYEFLGKELGARSNNPANYQQGIIQYDILAQEPAFGEGLQRVIQSMDHNRIVLLCAERDPLVCHRALLVARKLFERGIPISHIHADGSLESHQAMESRLLSLCKLPEGDLFRSKKEFVVMAYAIQGKRVAYHDESMEHTERVVTG